MEIKNFYDLDTWKDTHALTLEIYKITKGFPADERFSLVSQMRRSASSIGANIAEGFGRFHFKEKIKFYQQARGSGAELQNHLLLAKDLGYLSEDVARKTLIDIDLVLKEINGLIIAINKQREKSKS